VVYNRDMSALLFQIVTLSADLLIFLFVGYYFLKFHSKEKEIDKKTTKIDTDYHHIVDDALTKERTILNDASTASHHIVEDATAQADQIISGAQYISQATQETVDQALQKLVVDIEKEALSTAQDFAKSYQASLKQLSSSSLNDFQVVVKGLEADLQKQIQDFHETLFSQMKGELEEYKKARLAQTEQTITKVIEKASQEIFNKSISLSDHQSLVIEALEKAKREGIFD
jgi:vacuolar-type H+-ATPase subunit E/Vma4